MMSQMFQMDTMWSIQEEGDVVQKEYQPPLGAPLA